MQVNYKFTSDIEPTDEQLHLIMQEVAIEVKKKSKKSDELFWEQFNLLVSVAKKNRLALSMGNK